MKRRVVYCCPVPAPYRNAELDRAAAALGRDSLHTVFDFAQHPTASWQPTLPAVCPFHCLNGTPEQHGLHIRELPRLLSELDPAVVVIGGYSYPVTKVGLRWCRARGVPYVFRTDTNIWGDRQKGLPRYLLRRLRLRPWLQHARACLITGSYNREFWRRYGMRPDQEGWWPQWIDYDHFAHAANLRNEEQPRLKQQFHIRPEVNLLYVGRLIPRKRVDILCEALCQLDESIGLVVAGHGEDEPRLRERYAARLGPRLTFAGAVPQTDLVKLYAATDVLVLASGAGEPWALVLNEAGIGGMPIICHRHVGAAGDLLIDGQNGAALASDDPAEWATAIRRVTTDRDRLLEMGRQSTTIVARWRDQSEPADCLRRLIA